MVYEFSNFVCCVPLCCPDILGLMAVELHNSKQHGYGDVREPGSIILL